MVMLAANLNCHNHVTVLLQISAFPQLLNCNWQTSLGKSRHQVEYWWHLASLTIHDTNQWLWVNLVHKYRIFH